MPKFSGTTQRAHTPSPVRVVSDIPDTFTHEGAPAFTRDVQGELFLTALTSMVREDTFYESAQDRDSRLVGLIHQATLQDPAWVRHFASWLRTEGFMRSASLVVAAEYVAAGGPAGRSVVNAVLRRADEPAEMLAYWIQTHGRNIPQPIKRGVADAVRRLYNERNLLKYDGSSRGWRFGDVIELVHPKPTAPWQGDLFKFALDRRRHDVEIPGSLPMVGERSILQRLPEEQRRGIVRADNWASVASQAGITWEFLSGWLPGGMDAEAWEAVIPQMGYMARLRNLRNFDEAGVSDEVKARVAGDLADPDQVASSMQFPYRFYSAWKQALGLHWGPALEKALDLSTQNIPVFEGRTLIVSDVSESMDFGPSKRSGMTMKEAAAVFGASILAKNRNSDLVAAATQAAVVPWQGSVLRTVDMVRSANLGGGTELGAAVRGAYQSLNSDYARVIVLTDGQFWDTLPNLDVPYYLFNLNAYKSTPIAAGRGKDHELGGLSDATFRLIPLLEMERAGVWPWE